MKKERAERQASVTSAIVKSAMVIGYKTAPKQLWPEAKKMLRSIHVMTRSESTA